MIKKGEGSIVNIGSNSWWEAVGNFPAYATAKSAVHGLSRTLARDLGQHRIRVNTVVPGWIMTDRQKELWLTPEALEKQYIRAWNKEFKTRLNAGHFIARLFRNQTVSQTAYSILTIATFLLPKIIQFTHGKQIKPI